MNKAEALEIASVAHELLMLCYGQAVFDSSTAETLALRLIRLNGKVPYWMQFVPNENSPDEIAAVKEIYPRYGLEVYLDSTDE